MVVDIKMCRFDNVPWGFRLVGGKDFECPLYVVKVMEHSVAEEAGLRPGDIIVRINDTPTSPLTHEETHRLIMSCGNSFYFGVQREPDDEQSYEEERYFQISRRSITPTPELKVVRPSKPTTPKSPNLSRKSPPPMIQIEEYAGKVKVLSELYEGIAQSDAEMPAVAAASGAVPVIKQAAPSIMRARTPEPEMRPSLPATTAAAAVPQLQEFPRPESPDSELGDGRSNAAPIQMLQKFGVRVFPEACRPAALPKLAKSNKQLPEFARAESPEAVVPAVSAAPKPAPRAKHAKTSKQAMDFPRAESPEAEPSPDFYVRKLPTPRDFIPRHLNEFARAESPEAEASPALTMNFRKMPTLALPRAEFTRAESPEASIAPAFPHAALPEPKSEPVFKIPYYERAKSPAALQADLERLRRSLTPTIQVQSCAAELVQEVVEEAHFTLERAHARNNDLLRERTPERAEIRICPSNVIDKYGMKLLPEFANAPYVLHSAESGEQVQRERREFLRSPTPDRELSPQRQPELQQAADKADSPEYLPEQMERSNSVMSESAEIKLVEEEIAAVLSGDSELLQEHNVLGVNFYRLFPKPGVCMASDVLRTLNEDATKTKAEKDKENKKWTTFLQKPNRPIPKSKLQLEAERRAANAYKVKIVVSPRRTPEPEVARREISKTPEPELQLPTLPVEVEVEVEVEEPAPADNELPNLEEIPAEENNAIVDNEPEELKEQEELEQQQDIAECEEVAEKEVSVEKALENETEEQEVLSEQHEMQPVEAAEGLREKTEEEIALERQLADVQRQLAALSNLPSTIQSTLDAVTKQLAELLPAIKQTNAVETQQVAIRQINLAESVQQQEEEEQQLLLSSHFKDVNAKDNNPEAQQQQQQLDAEYADVAENAAAKLAAAQNQAINSSENDNHYDNSDRLPRLLLGQNETEAQEECDELRQRRRHLNEEALENIKNKEKSSKVFEEMRQMDEEQNAKRQKKHDVIDELEEHLERKQPNSRSKRAFGPLTPSSERPLVLPGGRRWYKPKDAYNDEFIAETLSAQAELITGSTLGVNFMKYQKPEKKIDLNRSEVYKVIHHLDRQPKRGIEVRPPVVPAAVDIRNQESSI